MTEETKLQDLSFKTIKEAMKQETGKVAIRGWVYRERGSSKIRFLVIRDADQIIQCVVLKDKVGEGLFELADKLQIEASVKLVGEIKKDERAPSGYEITVETLRSSRRITRIPNTKRPKRRIPPRQKTPSDQDEKTSSNPQNQKRIHTSKRRILPTRKLLPIRHANTPTNPKRRRKHDLRSKILRQKNVPRTNMAVLRRSRHLRTRKNLQLRTNLQSRKKQDEQAPIRILDGRNGSSLVPTTTSNRVRKKRTQTLHQSSRQKMQRRIRTLRTRHRSTH